MEEIICSGSAIRLTAPTYDGADKQYWTLSGSTGTISPSSTDNIVTVSGLTEGSTSTMTWTVEKNGCTAKKVYTLKNGSATVTGGDDQLLCGTTNSAKIGISYTGGDGGKVVKWINTATGEEIQLAQGASDKQITVTDLPEGTTIFRAIVYSTKNYECVTTAEGQLPTGEGVATAEVKVTRVVATASAAPNSVCSTSENITLTGSPLSEAGAGATGEWTADGGTITSVTTSNEATATVNSVGTATFTWNVKPVITLKNGQEFSCTAKATTSVTYGGGADQLTVSEFCAVDNKAVINVGFDNSSIDVDEGVYFDKSSGSGTPTITPTEGSATEATVTNLANGTTEIRWRATTKDGCHLEAKIPIYNLDPPAPSASDSYVCDYNTAVELTASAAIPGATGVWDRKSGDAELVVNSTASNKATLHFASTSTDGINVIGWKVTYKTPKAGKVCESAEKLVTVENLAVTANAGNDIEICNYDMETNLPKTVQNTATLEASEINPDFNPPAVGVWTRPDGTSTGIESPNSNKTTVSNLSSGINKFQWKVTRTSSVNPDKQCTAKSNVTVYNSRVDEASPHLRL